MPLTKPEAEALTMLAVAARPSGARRWDGPGVIAALGKVAHLDLANVVMATMRAAADRSVDTPAVIANPRSPCWAERINQVTPRSPSRDHQCWSCGRDLDDCHEDHPKRRPESTGVDHAAQAQAARAAMQAATQRSTAHE